TRQETQPSADQLGLAQQIQARLAPAILPRWDELDIAVFREPGSARTGDMYDIVQLPNGLAGIVIAHASANGPDPAIMISQVQAAFRVSALHGDAPHVLMRELNWLIYDAQSDHRLACCAVLLEPRSGAIEYCTAGQPGAHIIDQSGRARGLVGLPNPPVGAELASTYASRPEQLDPAEVLVLFTPGFETLSNRSHQPFGRRRLIETLCRSIGQRPTAMLDDLATELRIFRQAGNQPDDITVLLVRREAHQPAAT
ncbi:MAG: PP2C family protein-serine/threonine phosphatase, partial [Phycisphaerae bacterium]